MKRKFWQRLNLLRAIRRIIRSARNALKRRHDLDTILFSLGGAIPALPEPRSWLERRFLGEPALSLWELEKAFQQIAADPRPKTVILFLRDPALSLADTQTLRALIERLRGAGKDVIAYAQSYDLGAYLIASACSRILMQPGGRVVPACNLPERCAGTGWDRA